MTSSNRLSERSEDLIRCSWKRSSRRRFRTLSASYQRLSDSRLSCADMKSCLMKRLRRSWAQPFLPSKASSFGRGLSYVNGSRSTWNRSRKQKARSWMAGLPKLFGVNGTKHSTFGEEPTVEIAAPESPSNFALLAPGSSYFFEGLSEIPPCICG